MMYQRPHSLVLDENINPIMTTNSDKEFPIKPISILSTKGPIKKSKDVATNNVAVDNSSVRTALSTIMARVKNLRRKQTDHLDETKPTTSTTTTTTATATTGRELKRPIIVANENNMLQATTNSTSTFVNNQENRDPQQQASTTTSSNVVDLQQPPLSKSLSTSSLLPLPSSSTIGRSNSVGGNIEDVNTTSTNTTSTNTTSTNTKQTTPQKKTSEELFTSPGIDKPDSEDPQSCIEYVKDIHSHYKKIETKYRSDPAYLSRQPFMRHKHRFTIVNWMLEVHQKFRLSTPTMYLAVDLLDRFLTKNDIHLSHLQLLGATCIFVASKYEDLQYPLSSDLVKVSMNTFTKEDLLRMERILLRDLDFNITVATVYPFLKRYLKCARCDFNQLALAYYLAELSLLEEASLYYLPSQIASACIFVAGRLCSKKDSWDSVLQYYTGYSEQDIEACASVMVKIAKKYSTNEIKTCTRLKYSHEEKGKVALVVMSYFNGRFKKD